MRRLSIVVLVCTAFAMVLPAAVSAQGIAVVVNGAPVTQLDVTSRLRLMQVTGNRAAGQQTALDELIDERLKLQEARRLRITITDAQVDTAFANIAQRSQLSPQQLGQALQQRGVNPRTLRDRLRADMAWQQVVQQRVQRTVSVRDADVVEALRRRGQDPDNIRAFEYTLSQVVLFGSGGDRRQAAEQLRSAINGCDDLREKVRRVRDAAARDPIRRVSSDLPQALREVIDRTAVGRATPAQQTALGLEFAVVCAKRDIPGRDAATAEVRQQLMSQEMETVSRRLLQEAREKATIERRRG
jgi:peptidyl-prolyl cis-trans isomerase SurA